MLKVAILALSAVLSGCVLVSAKSDGTVRMAILGQAAATVCKAEDCVQARGGAISEGAVEVLKP